MATTVETIRKLTFIAADSGLTQLHARLQAVVAAGGDVSQAAQAMAVSTTTAARGSASLEKDLARLEARLSPAAREAQNLEKVTRQLFAGMAQGSDPARIQRMFDLAIGQTTVEKERQLAIAKEQTTIDRALADSEMKRSRRIAEQVAYEERIVTLKQQQTGAAFGEDLNKSLGIEREMKSARESARVFEEKIAADLREQQVVEKALLETEQRRAKMAQERADYEERIATLKQQQQGAAFGRSLDESFGLGPAAAAASKTSRDQFASQFAEQERLMRFASEIKQASNAAGAAQQRLMKETIDLAHAQQLGAFTAKEFADAQAYLANKATLSSKGIGLASNQITQLGFQINDVISGLAMGQSVLTIFAQQTGQIVQVLQGPQGLVQGFKDAAKWAVSFVTPATTALTALAAAAIYAAYAYNRFADQAIEAQRTVLGLGVRLGLTAQQFMDLTKAAAEAGKISTASGAELGNALARGTKVGADNIARLIALSKDFGATIGESGKEANDSLVKAFSDVGSIIEFDRRLNFLNGSQRQTIKNLAEIGENSKAARVAIDALNNGALVPSVLVQGRLAQATEALGRYFSNLTTEVGRYIASLNDLAATEARRKALPQFAPFGAEGRRKAAVKSVTAAEESLVSADAAAAAAKTPTTTPEQIAKEKELNAVFRERSKQFEDWADEFGRSTAEGQKWLRTRDNLLKIERQATQAQREEIASIQGTEEARDKIMSTTESLIDSQGKLINSSDRLQRIQELGAKIALEVDETRKRELTAERDELQLAGQVLGTRERSIKVNQAAVDSQVAHIKTVRDDINYSQELRTTYGLTGDALESANQMTQKRIQYEQQGITITKADTAALKEQVDATINHNRAQAELNKLYQDFIKPGEDFVKVVNAADQKLSEGTISATQYGDAVLTAQIKMEEAKKTMAGGFTAGLLSVQKEFGDTSKLIQGFVTSSANTLTTALADMFDGTKKTSDGFKDLSKAVLRSLTEMVIKAMIVAPIFKGLQAILGGGGLNLGSIFGGGSAATVKAGAVHSGGIIRDGVGVMRYVHPAYFENAPRFHSGGLASGEIPAILRRNEEVLTPENPRHVFNSGGGMLTVNVEGARGNQEIMSMVQAGVQGGLAAYDKGLNGGGLARKMSNVRMRGQR